MSLQLTEDDMRSLLFGDYMKPDVVGVMFKFSCEILALPVGAKAV